MECPYCKNTLPDDSKFCQFCGKTLAEEIEKNILNAVPISSEKAKKTATLEKKKQIGKKLPKLSVILGILCFLLLACNVFQLFIYFEDVGELKETVTELRAIESDRNQTIAQQRREIQNKEDDIQKLKTVESRYNSIVFAAEVGNLGYGASNFKVDTPVICVKQYRSAKVTLTASWYNGGTVSIYNSNTGVSSVTFDQNQWYGATATLTVQGLSTGVSIITFSNNVDNSTFKMIVIVP